MLRAATFRTSESNRVVSPAEPPQRHHRDRGPHGRRRPPGAPLSDQFSDLPPGCADYIMVEGGNDDGASRTLATDAGIPITMLYTIADAVTPAQEIFGA